MTPTDRHRLEPDAELRERLRAADPVTREAGREAEILGRLARRIGSLEPSPRRGSSFGRLVPAAAAMALIAAGWWLAGHRQTSPTSTNPIEHPAPAARTGGPAPGSDPVQLQFETPGGTRVVWVLTPDLTL